MWREQGYLGAHGVSGHGRSSDLLRSPGGVAIAERQRLSPVKRAPRSVESLPRRRSVCSAVRTRGCRQPAQVDEHFVEQTACDQRIPRRVSHLCGRQGDELLTATALDIEFDNEAWQLSSFQRQVTDRDRRLCRSRKYIVAAAAPLVVAVVGNRKASLSRYW